MLLKAVGALFLLLLAVLFLPLISFGGWAHINDCAVKIEIDSGYRVKSIDGKAPRRVSHPIISMVPYVKCRPGEVEIEAVAKDWEAPKTPRRFVATLERSTTYRIAEIDGELVLVEHPH